MRCLLVEDEPDRVKSILPELIAIFGNSNVDVAVTAPPQWQL